MQDRILHLLDPCYGGSISHQKFIFEDLAGGGKLLSTSLQNPKLVQTTRPATSELRWGWKVPFHPRLNGIPKNPF